VAVTSDLGTLKSGIARVDSLGGTALRDAIVMGESYLQEHATRDRRVLLAITDGRDNASQATEKEIAAISRQTDTAVYGIGLFAANPSEAKDGRRELEAVTQPTGGIAAYPGTLDEIDNVVQDLARQIRRQYTIAYAPTNQALDGTYRKIRVEARGPEPMTVRTRAGYVAQPPSAAR